jgi:hypothetical protein
MSHKRWAIQRPGSCIDRPKPRTMILGDDHDAWGSITQCLCLLALISPPLDRKSLQCQYASTNHGLYNLHLESKRVRDNSLQRETMGRVSDSSLSRVPNERKRRREKMFLVSWRVKGIGWVLCRSPEPSAAHRQPLPFSASSIA